MRIALLSTLDRDPRPGRIRPAFVQFAGASVIQRQLDLALSLGCEAVACLAEGIGREVIELQHRAERGGARFVAVRDPAKLSGLVTANDEILVIASGILPDDEEVARHLSRNAVIAFPAETAVAAGFERIDATTAWSGVMLARGSLVERLTELPPDIDVPSALMRLALQSGTSLAMADRRLVDEADWTIDATAEELKSREARWIEGQREAVPFTAPGIAIGERAGTRLAKDIVGRKSEAGPAVVAAVFAGFAVLAAWLEVPSVGFGLLTAAALFARMARVIDRIAQRGPGAKKSRNLVKFTQLAIDPAFVFVTYLASAQEHQWVALFIPLMLFGLLRLGERHGSDKWRKTYADRILLGALLAPAAFFGFAAEAAAGIALAVLASRFVDGFRAS